MQCALALYNENPRSYSVSANINLLHLSLKVIMQNAS